MKQGSFMPWQSRAEETPYSKANLSDITPTIMHRSTDITGVSDLISSSGRRHR